ncbi:Fe-S cluster assembly protein SufD [Pseudoalteromonas sp.]|uniref:Fe-S cluster assembly protein SufD n=1 Tax=Pseudoalteromonas sp. TaxID=53249 RepID=UPI001BCABF84|nr:Fe-S cluster assembly protein SufD [Pseudoalteromonas sp.]
MNQWLQQVIEHGQSCDDWLSPLRAQSLAKLHTMDWPHRRIERWKYTSLNAFDDLTLNRDTAVKTAPPGAIEGLDSIDLVFINGILHTDLKTQVLPKGLRISGLLETPKSEQDVANNIFNKVKPEHHFFGLVNDVLAQDGLIIDIEANTNIAKPIRVVSMSTDKQGSHQRILVRVGANAKVTIIEQEQGDAASVSTCFAEYDIGKEAYVEHYRFAMQSAEAMYFGGCHFSLQDHAQLNSTLIAYGSALSRIDVDIVHNGQYTQAKFNTLYLLGQSEHFDLHSTIEHAMPNGTTEENARGIIGDKAKAVFNGRIHIHRDAQKTRAELNNRNLLLSRRGQVNTKPELEIYADDVQCAHGATIAEIEEDALYYLRSRGIARAEALVMLNFGFIQQLINDIPNKHIAQWLEPKLKSRFVKMQVI